MGREGTGAGAGITPEEAQERLETVQELMDVLASTDPEDGSATGAVPSREARERVVAPGRAVLETLARRARRTRRRGKATPTAKEQRGAPSPTKEAPPMRSDPTHRPGQVIEEPPEETRRREQAAAAQRAAAPPGFPPELWPEISAFEGVMRVPNPEAVKRQRALDLATRMLAYPERARAPLVALEFYRLAQHGPGGR